jgi:metallo-beta-lactamase family protein
MAELTFVGAAGVVTGSKHLLTYGGASVLVDCGLFQGPPAVEALNAVHLPVRPYDIDAIVITHGHLDHVGYLPKAVRDGFHGPIYCTPATADVMEIVLEDAARIQEHAQQRGYHHERAHGLPPLFDDADVQKTLGLVKPVLLGADFNVCGASARFREAGHILGAAFVELSVDGKRIAFSGDVGRYDRMLLADPAPLAAADVVVCEATYGDRVHDGDPLSALEAALIEALGRGGPIVIPAFAVERSQEILFAIGRLQ